MWATTLTGNPQMESLQPCERILHTAIDLPRFERLQNPRERRAGRFQCLANVRRPFSPPCASCMSICSPRHRRGVESRLVIFPDENHWVTKPENRCVLNYTPTPSFLSRGREGLSSEVMTANLSDRFCSSLKWHYELFRWFAKHID